MIDIGLSKIALIGVVALVVIGPEKLPTVARVVGSLIGRAQRYINEVKSEVNREIDLEELRKMQTGLQEAVADVEQAVSENLSQAESALNSEWVQPETHPLSDPTPTLFSSDQIAVKAKDFRRKKLSRSSAVPSWYKRQNRHGPRMTSVAARFERYKRADGIRSHIPFTIKCPRKNRLVRTTPLFRT